MTERNIERKKRNQNCGKILEILKFKKKLHNYLLHESNRINRDPNRSHVANSFFLSSEQTNKIQSSDDNYEFYKFHSIPQRSFHPVVFQRILQRDEEIQGDNKEGRWCAEDKIKFRESTKRGREGEVQIEFRVEKSWRVRRG